MASARRATQPALQSLKTTEPRAKGSVCSSTVPAATGAWGRGALWASAFADVGWALQRTLTDAENALRWCVPEFKKENEPGQVDSSSQLHVRLVSDESLAA